MEHKDDELLDILLDLPLIPTNKRAKAPSPPVSSGSVNSNADPLLQSLLDDSLASSVAPLRPTTLHTLPSQYERAVHSLATQRRSKLLTQRKRAKFDRLMAYAQYTLVIAAVVAIAYWGADGPLRDFVHELQAAPKQAPAINPVHVRPSVIARSVQGQAAAARQSLLATTQPSVAPTVQETSSLAPSVVASDLHLPEARVPRPSIAVLEATAAPVPQQDAAPASQDVAAPETDAPAAPSEVVAPSEGAAPIAQEAAPAVTEAPAPPQELPPTETPLPPPQVEAAAPVAQAAPPRELSLPPTAVPPPPVEMGAQLPGLLPTYIQIPSIKIDTSVYEVYVVGGVWQVAEYAAGYLHGTGVPGQPGNTVLAGHLGLRGAVFRTLPAIQVGSDIFINTGSVQYQYRVRETKIVSPTDLDVLNPTDTATLTLMTCSDLDTRRFVAIADLVTS